MKDYKYIAFDLDGTLINTEEGVTGAIRQMLLSYGVTEPNEAHLRACIGPPLQESLGKFFGIPEDSIPAAIDEFRKYYDPVSHIKCHPYEGIEETLKGLKEMGKKLTVATSKTVDPARKILRNFGLDKYFDHIEGTPMDQNDASKADVLRAAIKGLGCEDLNQMILVGDTKFDIIGANEVGLDTLAVTYGFGKTEDFKEHGATYIINTTADILNFFK